MSDKTEQLTEKVLDLRDAAGEAIGKIGETVSGSDAVKDATEKAKAAASTVAGTVSGAVQSVTGRERTQGSGSKRLLLVAGLILGVVVVGWLLRRAGGGNPDLEGLGI